MVKVKGPIGYGAVGGTIPPGSIVEVEEAEARRLIEKRGFDLVDEAPENEPEGGEIEGAENETDGDQGDAPESPRIDEEGSGGTEVAASADLAATVPSRRSVSRSKPKRRGR